MSVTVAKQTFKGDKYTTVIADMHYWIVAQIPELKLVESSGSNWVYKFGDTDYGVSFTSYRTSAYTYYLEIEFVRWITEDSTSKAISYDIYTSSITENGTGLYTAGAIVVRTPHGVIIQGMTYTGIPHENFFYFGKASSAIKGEVTVHGIFSAASYVYTTAGSTSQSKFEGSIFYFKIDSETPVAWRHGVLTAIRPRGASYGAAGSIVASAVYGVTGAIWAEPIRIDAFYSLDGPVSPPYYTEVTAGGRKMQRVGKELLLEG